MANSYFEPQRNYGIDLLRILSMFMILILHILGHGGILKSLPLLSPAYETAWFLEILCYCAVNCYALISGYVGYSSKFKYSHTLILWLQVAFYSILITAITAKLSPEVGMIQFRQSFFPLSNNLYWYFTAYFGLSLFIPCLNGALTTLDRTQLKFIGLTIMLIFSFLPLLAEEDLFVLKNGYSVLWLISLYLLGGIVKKCDLGQKIKPFFAFCGYFLLCVVVWMQKYIVESHNAATPDSLPWISSFVNYTSFPLLLAALLLLIGFSHLKIKKSFSKIISILSPLTFGIYLIHDNPYVRQYFITDRLSALTSVSVLIFTVLGYACALFLACSFIDFLRKKLFTLLRIKTTLSSLEDHLTKKFSKIN